jgi:selenophosphate synthase
LQDLMFDAETSGGLLIAVAPDRAEQLEAELSRRQEPVHHVGVVQERGSSFLTVD